LLRLVWTLSITSVLTCIFATQFTYRIYLFDAKTIIILLCTLFTIVNVYIYIDAYPFILNQDFVELIAVALFKLTLLCILYYEAVN